MQIVRANSGEIAGELTARIIRGTRLDRTKPNPTIVTPAADHWLSEVNQIVGRAVVDLDQLQPPASTFIGIVTTRELARCIGWPEKDVGFADVVALATGTSPEPEPETASLPVPSPQPWCSSISSGPAEYKGLIHLTADPNQFLFLRLLTPGSKEIGGYAYVGRAEIPKVHLDAIDRLAAEKRTRKRAENGRSRAVRPPASSE